MHNMTIGHCTSYVPHGITGPNHPHSLYKQVLNTRASHSCENYAYTTRGGGLTLCFVIHQFVLEQIQCRYCPKLYNTD